MIAVGTEFEFGVVPLLSAASAVSPRTISIFFEKAFRTASGRRPADGASTRRELDGPQRPFRGGRVHVLAEKCSSCVFRPGNLMSLNAGRLKNLLDENLAADSALQCHQTLEYSTERRPAAVCRGFFDHPRADESAALRLAKALPEYLAFDPTPEETTHD